MFKKIKKIIKESNTPFSEWLFVKYYERREAANVRKNGFGKADKSEENRYHEKWSPILRFKTPDSFRLYSHFIENDRENIVSQMAAFKVNDLLNPPRYSGYISDKNNFDRLLPNAGFPKTILRKIDGVIYDDHYNYILPDEVDARIKQISNDYDKVIIKPTTDSDSGHGVKLIVRRADESEAEFSNGLKEAIYDASCSNLIVQECLKQDEFLSQFNPTSINTIRIATYRSVITNKADILSVVIRLGAKGKHIDNLHAGGHMVRVSDSGELAHYCIDQYGTKFYSHNDIELKNRFVLPRFDMIKSYVLELSQKVLNARLIQWDIMIDDKGNPRVIEYNTSGFSMWIAQMTGTPAFGKYTDEIIEYCTAKLKQAN